MKWTFYPVSAFEQYAVSWDELNGRGYNSPLLSSQFLLASLQAFKSGKEMLAVMGDIDHPEVMAILERRHSRTWDTFQPAQAPIGFWLMRPGMNLEVTLNSLLHALPGFPLTVGITQQDPLLISRPQHSAKLLTLDYISTAHIPLCETYESYWQARGKNLRQNMRTVRNRLEKNGLSWDFKCIVQAVEVRDAVEHFGRMESAGWKAEQGTAVQLHGAQGKFYVNLLENFCKTGAGYIFCLTFNDAIVAMDLCVHQDGSVIVLKTTYDESYHDYSPAMLLHQEMLRMLMPSADFQRLEFYGKVRDWQLRLTDEVRTMYHVNVYRWSWLKRVMEKRIGLNVTTGGAA